MTINISKISVTKPQEKMYSITLKLLVKDGTTEIINQDFSENHKVGNSVDYTLNKFKDKMQKTIDDYKEEQDVFTSSQLDTAITNLESQLTWQ